MTTPHQCAKCITRDDAIKHLEHLIGECDKAIRRQSNAGSAEYWQEVKAIRLRQLAKLYEE